MKRRFFLRSAGGLLLAAPFLPSLFQRAARAQAVAHPRRSVIFHSPSGCLTNRWFPKVEHGPLDASALAGTTLEVLSPFVNKLLVPRGLRAINAFGHPQVLDPHYQAMGSKLTCARLAAEAPHYASSHSLDHEIARQINPGGRDPLVLSVGTASANVALLLSYRAAGTPFPAVVSPQAVYAGLSGVLMDHSGEVESLRRRKLSVIDAVRDDLASYQRLNMSGADQKRISAWLELMRETEQGLSAAACNEGAAGIDAASVDAASHGTTTAEAFTVGADTMIKLMALSMLCDTNRSLILTFPGYATFNWDGIHHSYDHDALGHRTGSAQVSGACVPGVLDMLAQIDAWYAAKYAKLVALLDGLPEGEGTLLDNTATMWIQEFSDGSAMNLNNMPIVIAGSAGGYLKQGVAVNVEGSAIGPGNSEASCADGGDGQVHFNTGSVAGNVPINKLYVTLMNAVGCRAPDGGEVTSFGMLDTLTEPDGISNPGELSALKA